MAVIFVRLLIANPTFFQKPTKYAYTKSDISDKYHMKKTQNPIFPKFMTNSLFWCGGGGG